MKNKGFTLIELLVVVAIIGILATVVLASLGQARLRAKDAAVRQVVSSFRSEAELLFQGQFFGICSSDAYDELVDYINAQGGEVRCDIEMSQEYRIIATLPSGVTNEEFDEGEFGILSTEIAHANPGDAFCINGFNEAVNVNINDFSPFDGIPFPNCVNSASSEVYTNIFYGCPIPGNSNPCYGTDSEGNQSVIPNSYCEDANASSPSSCF